MDYGRMVTAMVTPFQEDGSIDFTMFDRLLEHLVATGTTAVVVAGTTGESPVLSHEEKLSLFARAVQTARGRIKVIAGTGSNNTAASIALTKEAEQLGVDGIMLVAPYYNKPSQDGLYEHFKAVAQATRLPVMLYNIPGRCGVNIDAETVVRLAQVDNITSVKEASGDLSQMAEIIARTPDDFYLYSGDDKVLLPVMAIGGHGVVSVASHVVGPQMMKMIQSFVTGDVSAAAAWHRRLLPVFEGLFEAPNPVLVKEALTLRGLPCGKVRLPLVPASEAQRARIRKILEQVIDA
jgi:4-hydroxy-tetrahydrodipicolinate synthase